MDEFYNTSPKIWALSPKTFGAKTCTNLVDCTKHPNLIANISGTSEDVQNQKEVIENYFSRVGEGSLVKFGPLTTSMRV